MTEPISWQIKVSDIMVVVDWKDLDRMKKDVIFDHPSYANMNMEKKNDTLNLQHCLNQRLSPRKEQVDTLCCSTFT